MQKLKIVDNLLMGMKKKKTATRGISFPDNELLEEAKEFCRLRESPAVAGPGGRVKNKSQKKQAGLSQPKAAKLLGVPVGTLGIVG